MDIPSSTVLVTISGALNRPPEYFLRSREVSLGCPSFRKRASLRERDEAAILAELRQHAERYLDSVELFRDQWSKFELPDFGSISSLADAETAAERLRAHWDLGMDSLESVTEVLEDRGALVVLVDAPESFDGCTCWINAATPAVVVRSGIPGDRQRLSLAHELGHIIDGPAPQSDREAFAFRFGAAFLVPKATALRELGKHRTAFDLDELHLLKTKYGLSMQAWIRRASDLGVIQPATYARYMKLWRTRGWHKEEPGSPYPPEEPTRLEQLALRALAEDLVTESRAAELAGHPLRKLRPMPDGISV